MPEHFEVMRAKAMRGIFQQRPELMGAFMALCDQVMASEAALTKLERELIGAHLSRQFGCDYCHLGHLDTVEALAGPEARDTLEAPDNHMARLFDLADKIAANTLTDDDIAAAVDAGLDEREVEDVVFVTALFGFANRMVTGFGITYDRVRDRAGSMALSKGYSFARPAAAAAGQ